MRIVASEVSHSKFLLRRGTHYFLFLTSSHCYLRFPTLESVTPSSPSKKQLSSFSSPRFSSFKSRSCCSIELIRLTNGMICSVMFFSPIFSVSTIHHRGVVIADATH